MSSYDLYYGDSSGGSHSYAPAYGVRPIITLKSDLKIVSGTDCDGSTKEKAYVLQLK